MQKISKISLALIVFLALPIMSFAGEQQTNHAAQGQTITDNQGNALGTIVTNPQTGVKNVVDGTGKIIGTVVGGAQGGVQNITNGAGKVIGTITNGVNGAVGVVTNTVGKVIGGVTSGISSVIGGATGALSGALGGLLGNGYAPNGTRLTFANALALNKICTFDVATDKELKIISQSVDCFESMFMGIVESKLRGMSDFLREAVFACLVLYVIFYGIKISTGIITEQRTRSEFFIHALKIAFVSWMITDYGMIELWYLTLDIYNGLLALVLVPNSYGDCASFSLFGGLDILWDNMDCTFSNLIGWDSGKPGWDGIPLLFGMFTSSLNSGAGGGFIAMLVVMSIFSVLMALLRVAMIYILSMMTLILLFMISPIVIPMMLFTATKQMFDGWWKTIISMVLQPVILFAYLSFMLSMYREILEGEDGLKAIYQSTQLEPNHQVGATTNRGTDTGITSVFSMFKKDADLVEMEPKLVFNLISVFVISYLLSAFTAFVAQMGRELSGNSLSPDLSGAVPSFMR